MCHMKSQIVEIINKIFYWLYARNIWEAMLIMFVFLCVWVVAALKLKKYRGWQIFNLATAIFTVAIILYLTLGKRSGGVSDNNWIPFHFIIDGGPSWSARASIRMNALLFFPLGLVFPFALPKNIKHKVLWSLAFAALLSLGIEVVQTIFNMGFGEADDVLLNLLGTAIGSLAYLIQQKISNKIVNS